MADERKSLSAGDWSDIGNFIKQEKDRRAARRKDRERIWKEIDRQVALTPLAVESAGGDTGQGKKDWYPELESPLQFNTLEVLAADARRMKFPRGTAWFEVSSELSEAYLARWTSRRQTKPMVDSVELILQQLGKPPMNLDQETADILVKAVLDHYHKLYDFRLAVDLLDTEALKYGTCIGRVLEVGAGHFKHDYRGTQAEEVRGPALIPCSIKQTYLDDSTTAVMHEGVVIGPSFIRCAYQGLEDLKRAARVGGSERGWMADRIRRLVPIEGDTEHKGQIELLEFEGDLVVPKTKSPLFLPNVITTVAVGNGMAEPVRFRENPDPFRSYVVGHYMRDDVASPYGVSPLMKGQPLAEAISQSLNDVMAASLLNTKPPVSYDRFDASFAAAGGPIIEPGALWGVDDPKKIVVNEIGKPHDLMQVLMFLMKMYEDVVGVNAPRRGAEVKSHTGSAAYDIQSTKGFSRTDDFVTGFEQGPLTSILHMEYAIAKRVMRAAQSIPVDAGGIDGWVKVASADLPDQVAITVNGSAGVFLERERAQSFSEAVKFAAELSQLSIQTAQMMAQSGIQVDPVMLDFNKIVVEGFTRAGIQNPAQFIAGFQGSPAGPTLPAALPPVAPGVNGGGAAPEAPLPQG